MTFTFAVITVATQAEGYYDALKQGCERAGVRLVTLGWGKKWRGYAWKLRLVSEFLNEERDRLGSSLIVFVDGFDVLPTFRSVEELSSAYERANGDGDAKVVLGVDSPPQSAAEFSQAAATRGVFGTCMGRPINSGVYAGPLPKLLKILELCSAEHEGNGDNDNDQRMLSRACRRNNDWFEANAVFDDNAALVLNATCALSARTSSKIQAAAALKSDPTRTPAAFLHGAGDCDMDAAARTLSLPKRVQRSRAVTDRVFSRDGYARYFVAPVIILILLVVGCILYKKSTRKCTLSE
jgi:hypothetical protein